MGSIEILIRPRHQDGPTATHDESGQTVSTIDF
jgi:hypothetical protein